MYLTERLVLRTADEVEIANVLDYYRENQKHLQPYEPIREDKFYTYREQGVLLSFEKEHLHNQTGLKLYISKKNQSKIIGILNFSSIIMGGFCSCFIGYGLDHRYLSNGFMTEACKKGIGIMFDQYKLHRIEGNVMPRNESSIKILKKLGFESEGLAKKYLRINGNWEDHEHYVLLNEEVE
jgi:ribosomal-protein-alanine N-acetyltransferase